MNSFRFRVPEYHHQHKASDWYWAVGIIAVSAAATAVILNNILLAVLIILGAFSLSMYASREPQEQDIEISDAGVTVGKFRFSYSNLKSFWIEHHEQARLLIKTNRTIMPHLVILVDSLDENERNEIRQFLATKLIEEEQHEPLLEQIMEYIGF